MPLRGLVQTTGTAGGYDVLFVDVGEELILPQSDLKASQNARKIALAEFFISFSVIKSAHLL